MHKLFTISLTIIKKAVFKYEANDVIIRYKYYKKGAVMYGIFC